MKCRSRLAPPTRPRSPLAAVPGQERPRLARALGGPARPVAAPRLAKNPRGQSKTGGRSRLAGAACRAGRAAPTSPPRHPARPPRPTRPASPKTKK